MDSARHVIRCHSTQAKRVQNALDDVASIIHQSLARLTLLTRSHGGVFTQEIRAYNVLMEILSSFCGALNDGAHLHRNARAAAGSDAGGGGWGLANIARHV